MHRKNIRRIITKQLKTEHPHWKKMTRKSKKKLLQQIVDEAVNNYDYSQTLDIPIEELTGVEDQISSGGIRSIPEMADYIKNFHNDNLFDFDKRRKPYSEIIDQELQFIINSFIAPDGYSAAHREVQPYQLFRMELLKIIKYPEISYRKFCSDEYFGRERKQNRRFVRLPLNTKDQVHHTELCHFRMGLLFRQLMNVFVYFFIISINQVALKISSFMALIRPNFLLK